MYKNGSHKGRITIICGPMFSGKSEETQRRIRRAKVAKKKILCFKHKKDTRDTDDQCATHAGNILKKVKIVERGLEIFNYLDDKVEIIVIEEFQFWDADSVIVLLFIAQRLGIHLIVNSLLSDFNAAKFGPLYDLLPFAEEIVFLTAICPVCGSEDAIFSQRISDSQKQVLLGRDDQYSPRCRKDFRYPREILAKLDEFAQIFADLQAQKSFQKA